MSNVTKRIKNTAPDIHCGEETTALYDDVYSSVSIQSESDKYSSECVEYENDSEVFPTDAS